MRSQLRTLINSIESLEVNYKSECIDIADNGSFHEVEELTVDIEELLSYQEENKC